MLQAFTRLYRGMGSSKEPSEGSKEKLADAPNNAAAAAAAQPDLDTLRTQVSLEDWRNGAEAGAFLEEQEDMSEASDEQDEGDAQLAVDMVRGLTRTRSWVEKHSSLRKKRRVKPSEPDERAFTPAELPTPESGAVSQPAQQSVRATGLQRTPGDEIAGASTERGHDPWKTWDAYYRSLSPTGEPPERQRMLVEQPKKLKPRPAKQQKEEKQLWDAFGKALQGQLTQAILQ